MTFSPSGAPPSPHSSPPCEIRSPFTEPGLGDVTNVFSTRHPRRPRPLSSALHGRFPAPPLHPPPHMKDPVDLGASTTPRPTQLHPRFSGLACAPTCVCGPKVSWLALGDAVQPQNSPGAVPPVLVDRTPRTPPPLPWVRVATPCSEQQGSFAGGQHLAGQNLTRPSCGGVATPRRRLSRGPYPLAAPMRVPSPALTRPKDAGAVVGDVRCSNAARLKTLHDAGVSGSFLPVATCTHPHRRGHIPTSRGRRRPAALWKAPCGFLCCRPRCHHFYHPPSSRSCGPVLTQSKVTTVLTSHRALQTRDHAPFSPPPSFHQPHKTWGASGAVSH